MPAPDPKPTCLWCHNPLPTPKKQGRPRTYCCDNCRKYAAQHRTAHQHNREPIKVLHQTHHSTKTVLKRPTISQVLQAYQQDPNFAVELTKTLLHLMKIRPNSYHYDQGALEKFTATFTEVIFHWYGQMKLPSTKQFSFPSYAGLWRAEHDYTAEELEEFHRANRYFDENIEGILGTGGALEQFQEHLRQWEESYHAKQRKNFEELEEKNAKYGFALSMKERAFKEEVQFLKRQNKILRYELKREHTYATVILDWARQNCDQETLEVMFQAVRDLHDQEEAPRQYRTSYVFQLRRYLKMFREGLHKHMENENLEWVEDKTPLEATGIDEELVEFLAENSLDQQEDFRASCPSDAVDFEGAERAYEQEREDVARYEDAGLEESDQVLGLKQQVAEYEQNNRQLFVAAFERQEEAKRLRSRVEELERQNRNLGEKIRKAKRKR